MDAHTAIVLCGGRGTRIAAVASDKPKVLLPIGGEPFLGILLRHLQSEGVHRAVLSIGHLGAQVEAFVHSPDCNTGDLEVRCVQETSPLGTGGAVRLAADTLGLRASLLVINGDTFFSGSLRSLQHFHEAQPDAKGTLALVPPMGGVRYGRVLVDALTGEVKQFAEKAPAAASEAWISAGVYLLGSKLVAGIAVGRSVSLENEVFPRWVARGLYGCRMPDATILDFGTPRSYAHAQSVAEHLGWQKGGRVAW